MLIGRGWSDSTEGKEFALYVYISPVLTSFFMVMGVSLFGQALGLFLALWLTSVATQGTRDTARP